MPRATPPAPYAAGLRTERWLASIIQELGLRDAGVDMRAEPLRAIKELAIRQGRRAALPVAGDLTAANVSELLDAGCKLVAPRTAIERGRFCRSCAYYFVRSAGGRAGSVAMTCSGHHETVRLGADQFLAGVGRRARLLLVSDN